MVSLGDIISNPNLHKFLHRCWHEQDVYLAVTTCNQKFRECWGRQRRVAMESARQRRELFERLRLDQERYPQPLQRTPGHARDLEFRARWLQTYGRGGYAPGGSPWGDMLGALLDTPEAFCHLHDFWRHGQLYIVVTSLTSAFRQRWVGQRELVLLLYQNEIAYRCYRERMRWWPAMFGDPYSEWVTETHWY